MVIEALGQSVPDELMDVLRGIAFTGGGLVKGARDGSFETDLEGVFVAGDLLNGGTTAVQCISEGMKAAEEINRLLQGRRSRQRAVRTSEDGQACRN